MTTPNAPTVGAQHAVPALDNAELIVRLRTLSGVFYCPECLRAADALEAQNKRIAGLESQLLTLAKEFQDKQAERDKFHTFVLNKGISKIESLESELAAATARAEKAESVLNWLDKETRDEGLNFTATPGFCSDKDAIIQLWGNGHEDIPCVVAEGQTLVECVKSLMIRNKEWPFEPALAAKEGK